MNWQVKYSLANINEDGGFSRAEHVQNEVIRITTTGQPDVLAVISDARRINEDVAKQYVQENPGIDFLCGYRKECVWEGGAISYLQEKHIGWGSFGTLRSAAHEGNANTAEHKVFFFATRLISQYGVVTTVEREFDRIFQVTLKNGCSIRVGLIPDYEPTADNIRSLWESFGPVDIAWNINPNGSPCANALVTGEELGCKVLKTEGMKSYLQTLS